MASSTQYLVVFTSSDDHTYVAADQIEASSHVDALVKWLNVGNDEIDNRVEPCDFLNEELSNLPVCYEDLQWEMQLRFNVQMHVVPMSTVLGE